MKKSQLTIIVIVGLIVVVIFGFLFVAMSNRVKDDTNTQQTTFASENLQQSFDQCARDAVINANEEFGLENSDQYDDFISSSVGYCMSDFFSHLREQDYAVTTGWIDTTSTVFEKTISVSVDYPITVRRGKNQFEFEEYRVSFPRENTVSAIRIDDEEIILRSPDGRANIIIPKGTRITDSEGNLITSLSVKLADKNFDGLENNVVVGELVYDAQPTATFSKPVQVILDYRAQDYPLSVNKNSLSIAWWDSETGIWRGLETKVREGSASATTTHFTKFAIVTGCSEIGEHVVSKVIPGVYTQQYDETKQWTKSEEGQIYTSGKVDERDQNLAGESYVFGPDNDASDNYCDGFIETECCCQSHELITTIGEDRKVGCSAVPLGTCSGETATEDEMYYESDIEACNEKRKGYDDYQCLGGIVSDGDGDDAVFKLVFKENGNSCIKEFAVETFATPGATCTVSTSEEIEVDEGTGKPVIDIKQVEVKRIEEPATGVVETNTTCTAKISLIGVGASVEISDILDYTLLRECTNPGEKGYLEVEGVSTCAICKTDASGSLYYEPTDITECCGSDNERVAYCPGIVGDEGKICVNGQFEDWDDARCDSCCSAACKFNTGDCPFTEEECSIVTCVD